MKRIVCVSLKYVPRVTFTSEAPVESHTITHRSIEYCSEKNKEQSNKNREQSDKNREHRHFSCSVKLQLYSHRMVTE